MFDPYRRLLIVYNHEPERPKMQNGHEDLLPLKLQIETVDRFRTIVQQSVHSYIDTVILQAADWNRLVLALYDLNDVARRTL